MKAQTQSHVNCPVSNFQTLSRRGNTDWMVKVAPTTLIYILAGCLAGFTPLVFGGASDAGAGVAVLTGKIVRAGLQRYVMAYGMVEPEPGMGGKPAASYRVAAPAAGILAKIYCLEGEKVEKDQVLFDLDVRAADDPIGKAELAVEDARKNLAGKPALPDNENILRKQNNDAEQTLKTVGHNLNTPETQRDFLRIKAPLPATVVSIHFQAGQAVGPNTVLADLMDLDRLEVAMKIPSREAHEIGYRQPVEISPVAKPVADSENPPAIPPGKVVFISPRVDPMTSTVQVRATLDKKSGLHPGQYVYTRIVVERFPDRLAAPVESLVNRDGETVIFVVENGVAKPRPVLAGLRDGDLIEVVGENLREGMTVVTQGADGLSGETRIQVDR